MRNTKEPSDYNPPVVIRFSAAVLPPNRMSMIFSATTHLRSSSDGIIVELSSNALLAENCCRHRIAQGILYCHCFHHWHDLRCFQSQFFHQSGI